MLIKVRDLTKAFKSDSEALAQVNLTVTKGSIYGLLGSNGAGKTTLLKVIAGIMEPDNGKVCINGQEMKQHPELKQEVLFLPDIPYFFAQHTIKQMAYFYQQVYQKWNQHRFEQLSNMFDLPLHVRLHQLSKGKQRQAAFWFALCCMPDYLLLDEPLDGLDLVMRKKIKQLLMEDVAERNMTIVISSHNLRELENICDHVAILHGGTVLLERELDELKSNLHKIQVAFRGDIPSEFLAKLNIIHHEQRGSIHIFIVKGKEKKIHADVSAFQPLLVDVLPITLEEIFSYEMEEAGYGVSNFIF